MKSSMEIPFKKLGMKLPYDPVIPLLGISQFICSVMSNSLNPTDYSTPGFPVHHQLLELAQIHVHRVGDAIQQSHPLSSPSPVFNLSQDQFFFFSSESVLCITWPKYWSFSFSTSPSERLLLNHEKTPGFLASGGEELNLGPDTRLDRSELLCN